MKTAFIAAVVSAIVSAASGTAATILISIEEHQERHDPDVDISANAKRALNGNRGPRGIQEVTVVTSPPCPFPPGFPNARVEATCPDGEVPI